MASGDRSYPLVYIQKLSVPRYMNWNFTKGQDGVVVGNFGTLNAYQDSPNLFITGLLLGRFNKDYPIGEVPCRANTFLNKFLSAKRQYLAQNFRIPDWIHSTENIWWSYKIDFMLSTLGDILKEFGFYGAIKNV